MLVEIEIVFIGENDNVKKHCIYERDRWITEHVKQHIFIKEIR